MTPTSHPAEAVLADYAGGGLRPAFAAVVAAHLEACAHCRGQVRLLEAVGGALLRDLPPAEMDDDAVALTMARIERPPEPAMTEHQPAAERIPFGRPQWLGPGMSIRKAKVGAGGDLLYLLRLPAGIRTVPHSHEGLEFTTVLKGAFADGDQVFSAGDFAEMTDEADHQPQVRPEGECICLIASERPMRVRTWIGHIVQLVAKV